jgi:hypothetical protein
LESRCWCRFRRRSPSRISTTHCSACVERKNCRAGWHDIARQDYAHLRERYPFPSRPLADPSGRRVER